MELFSRGTLKPVADKEDFWEQYAKPRAIQAETMFEGAQRLGARQMWPTRF